jgi:CHAD domain-containing protein
MNEEGNIFAVIKRGISAQLEEALRLIEDPEIQVEDAVHDIRVLMKRARSLICLFFNMPDSNSAQREYALFREVARLFAPMRDNSVGNKTIIILKKLDRKLFNRIPPDHTLFSNIAVTAELDRNEYSILASRASSMLKQSLYRIRFLSVSGVDTDLPYREFEVCVNNCHSTYLRSRNTMKPSAIHKFRKKVKNLQYQLPFFFQCRKGKTRQFKKQLEYISRELGRYNDLAVLIKKWGYKYGNGINSQCDDEIFALIRNCQDKYLSEVWPLSQKIFVSEPFLNQVVIKSTVTRQ